MPPVLPSTTSGPAAPTCCLMRSQIQAETFTESLAGIRHHRAVSYHTTLTAPAESPGLRLRHCAAYQWHEAPSIAEKAMLRQAAQEETHYLTFPVADLGCCEEVVACWDRGDSSGCDHLWPSSCCSKGGAPQRISSQHATSGKWGAATFPGECVCGGCGGPWAEQSLSKGSLVPIWQQQARHWVIALRDHLSPEFSAVPNLQGTAVEAATRAISGAARKQQTAAAL